MSACGFHFKRLRKSLRNVRRSLFPGDHGVCLIVLDELVFLLVPFQFATQPHANIDHVARVQPIDVAEHIRDRQPSAFDALEEIRHVIGRQLAADNLSHDLLQLLLVLLRERLDRRAGETATIDANPTSLTKENQLVLAAVQTYDRTFRVTNVDVE